jgi:hypothetical protein
MHPETECTGFGLLGKLKRLGGQPLGGHHLLDVFLVLKRQILGQGTVPAAAFGQIGAFVYFFNNGSCRCPAVRVNVLSADFVIEPGPLHNIKNLAFYSADGEPHPGTANTLYQHGQGFLA